jgi:hypothetical protein
MQKKSLNFFVNPNISKEAKLIGQNWTMECQTCKKYIAIGVKSGTFSHSLTPIEKWLIYAHFFRKLENFSNWMNTSFTPCIFSRILIFNMFFHKPPESKVECLNRRRSLTSNQNLILMRNEVFDDEVVANNGGEPFSTNMQPGHEAMSQSTGPKLKKCK